MTATPLLAVHDLAVDFHTRDGVVRAVDGVSFQVNPGETVAILGESGSGKSVTAQAVMGILDSPPARISRGQIFLEGRALSGLPEKQLRAVRGVEIGMIFQDALSALNPVLSVGEQIAEMYRGHLNMGREQARNAAIEVMQRVQIPGARQRYSDYPHQFSGGMRQRIMIAMMIALQPKLLIADEPTTALDVTVQAQILALLAQIQTETNMGLLLITHDLGVVAEMAQRMLVMYAGEVVEQGSARAVLDQPAHPYTAALLRAVPSMTERVDRLPSIPGRPPNPLEPIPGCSFHPRCEVAQRCCSQHPGPDLDLVKSDRQARCWFAQEVLSGGES
ncbi:MAG: ABC transporter ATP-binding protein [Actinomycetia bacterium]|nr:ABC transporter ATP-binding protein [Actinomycetes bacterium]